MRRVKLADLRGFSLLGFGDSSEPSAAKPSTDGGRDDRFKSVQATRIDSATCIPLLHSSRNLSELQAVL